MGRENNDLELMGGKDSVHRRAAHPEDVQEMIVDNGENMETKMLTHKEVYIISSKC